MGFVKSRSPKPGTCMVKASAFTILNREWVVPDYLVKAENGQLFIPVWNLSLVGVSWSFTSQTSGKFGSNTFLELSSAPSNERSRATR